MKAFAYLLMLIVVYFVFLYFLFCFVLFCFVLFFFAFLSIVRWIEERVDLEPIARQQVLNV